MNQDSQFKEIKDRNIRIKLIDGSQINGQVNINRSSQYNRLSDLIASDREPFLVIANATVNYTDFENPITHKTLFVNKNHIIWASPDETQI